MEEMAIELRKEQRKDAIQSLEQHLREELETEVSGPSVHEITRQRRRLVGARGERRP